MKHAVRPHVKTHKIPSVAKEQLQAGAVGITVAKVSEAEVMADGGINDIFIAYSLVTGSKIQRVLRLSRRVRLIVGVDSLEGARRLSKLAVLRDAVLDVRLEVDTGLQRTGVSLSKAVDLATKIGTVKNLNLTGVYTYREATLRDGSSTLDLEGAGQEEGKLMISLANRMRDRGVQIRDVSLGSTPTAEQAGKVTGVTEIRPGTYVFYDRMQAQLGVCSLEECAATVVATIVSKPSETLAVIDGGSKTFATDVPPNTWPLDLEGFGHVIDHPGAILERLNEEHGMLRIRRDDTLRIGDTV